MEQTDADSEWSIGSHGLPSRIRPVPVHPTSYSPTDDEHGRQIRDGPRRGKREGDDDERGQRKENESELPILQKVSQ